MGTMKKVISKSNMIKKLLKSGYLLESRIENVLLDAQFHVETNVVFPDKYTQKTAICDG